MTVNKVKKKEKSPEEYTGNASATRYQPYKNEYSGAQNEILQAIMNPPKFSYDAESDPFYQILKEQAQINGTQAMEETVGQISARTGGIASSYAGVAGQQAYNGYMDNLNGQIPTLRDHAYSQYTNEQNAQRANFAMLQGMESTDYGRYMDGIGIQNSDRNFAYQAGQDGQAQDNWLAQFGYGQQQDAQSQANWQKQFGYGQQQDAQSQANWQKQFGYGQQQDAQAQANWQKQFETPKVQETTDEMDEFLGALSGQENNYNNALFDVDTIARTGGDKYDIAEKIESLVNAGMITAEEGDIISESYIGG